MLHLRSAPGYDRHSVRVEEESARNADGLGRHEVTDTLILREASRTHDRGYLVGRALRRAWAELEVTVEEGLEQLKTLCSMEIRTEDGGTCLRIPEPCTTSRFLLQALDLHLPDTLPHADLPTVTRKKLPERRKNR